VGGVEVPGHCLSRGDSHWVRTEGERSPLADLDGLVGAEHGTGDQREKADGHPNSSHWLEHPIRERRAEDLHVFLIDALRSDSFSGRKRLSVLQ
jgi:hypothetical protein